MECPQHLESFAGRSAMLVFIVLPSVFQSALWVIFSNVNTLLQLSVSLQVCGFMIHLNLPYMVHFA